MTETMHHQEWKPDKNSQNFFSSKQASTQLLLSNAKLGYRMKLAATPKPF